MKVEPMKIVTPVRLTMSACPQVEGDFARAWEWVID
jgi:hypothetical protein